MVIFQSLIKARWAGYKGAEESYMDGDSRLLFISAIILLFFAIFFAITEISFASATRPRLKVMSDAGNKKASKALYILDHFDKAISTILICTNIVHISIATLVTLAVTRTWGVNAVTVSTIITTMVLFLAGEMIPKSIAKKYPEPVALFCAAPLKVLMTVFSPASAFLSAVGNGASKLIKGEPELTVTEDELYDIIEDMTDEGTLDEEQGELISSAISFGELTVESILTPRVDIVAVDIEDSIEEILSAVKSCNHSRLPVYEGSIDNIIGILQIRKFIKSYLKNKEKLNVKAMLDKPLFIYQSMNVDELLPLMSRNKKNIAIVTDNYGGTLGLVTIEDMLEELVGEIWDEDDTVEESITKLDDGAIIVDADEHVDDVLEELDYEADGDEFVDKVMGTWAYESFGAIPKPGDSYTYGPVKVTVTEMDHNRIVRLRVEREGDAI